MDILPILFDAQLVIFVMVLIIWAKYETVIRWARMARRWMVWMIRRVRRSTGGIRCTDGHVVSGKPVPQMTAEEIVMICNGI